MRLIQRGYLFSAIMVLIACSCNDSSNPDAAQNEQAKVATLDTANSTEMTTLRPAGEKPSWGKGLTDPMALIIEKLVSFGAPPITQLSAQEARKQPSPTDATMAVMQEKNISVPPANSDTAGVNIMVKKGQVHLRIYTPKTGKNNYPVIVYYHGGGWVIADLNTYNASAQGLAEQVDAVVVSVAYRQAPEYKYPTAHEDSYAAYEWVLKNARSIKGDSKLVAVVGESAGGNLAAAVSMMARDKGVQPPVHEALVYPIAGYDFNTASYKESDSTKPLNSEMMKWFFKNYLADPSQGNSPMISLVTANLKGLPSTTIVAAEFDPLRSEGELLSENLKKAGVNTTYKLYKGVTHEFFGMSAVVNEAKQAQGFVSDELKKAFGK